MHHLSERLPQLSWNTLSGGPHPALTCPAILSALGVWKTQSDEGMDCAMNESLCVIFTFRCSSPLVFHYNNSLARSDKADDVAIRLDNSPQPERSTICCTPSFHTPGSRGNNGKVNERWKKQPPLKKQLRMQPVKFGPVKWVRRLFKVYFWSVYEDRNFSPSWRDWWTANTFKVIVIVHTFTHRKLLTPARFTTWETVCSPRQEDLRRGGERWTETALGWRELGGVEKQTRSHVSDLIRAFFHSQNK